MDLARARRHPGFVAALTGGRTIADETSFPRLQEEYQRTTHSLLKRYCIDCHSAADKQGELDLEQFTQFEQVRKAPAVWQKVAEMLDKVQRNGKTMELRKQLQRIYGKDGLKLDGGELDDAQLVEMSANLRDGIPMATPVFDGAREDDIEQFFEPGRARLSSQERWMNGAGLGLVIVREFVHAHRGRVTFERSPAGFATVRVILPMSGSGVHRR